MTVQQFTPDEVAYLKILKDPVLWAKTMFDWDARWYQKEILRDNHNRIVARLGRRAGKTDTMINKALHAAFTKPGRFGEDYVVLIITPFENQVELIFSRIRDLIEKSPELKCSVKNDKRNPQLIELYNGARIKGFTAGSKSGKGASNLRGQRADFLLLDEADFLADADINTIVSIVAEDAQRIKIIACSTPSGRRSHFYRWCTDKTMGWKHYHHPSSVIPSWCAETEMFFRTTLSELAYIQEIEAEFGEAQAGVFQVKYIDKAIELGATHGHKYYQQGQPLPNKKGPRILGVDWDKFQAATNMIIVEFDREQTMFKPIHRIEIARTEFTLDNAVHKIIDLNQTFDLDYIYLDRGYGEHQIEVLRKYGMNHPETGLHKKIVPHTFSDKISVPDPYTKQLEKKDIKPWMVNNAATIFERGLIALDPSDKALIKQLEEYHVVAIGSAGRPSYSDKNEHILDALMLALLGMTMKYDEIMKIKMARQILVLPKIMKQDYGASSRDIETHPKKQKTGLVVINPSSGNIYRKSTKMPLRTSF